MPSISELEKSVEPSPNQVAADKAAAESLRALREKDSMRILPPDSKEAAPNSRSSVPTVASPITSAPTPKGDSPADLPTPGNVPLRRKAKLTDFARVLLPKSEDPLPKDDSIRTTQSGETAATPVPAPAAVVPASFPVSGTAGNMIDAKAENPGKGSSGTSETNGLSPSPATAEEKKRSDFSVSAPETLPSLQERDSSLKDTTRVTLPEPLVTPPPKIRPAASALETAKPPTDSREKREFILANGERILGHILSETADTIYLDHPTLGVLTLPRTQIAAKPIEVILINGDRIVGDLIAETTECLYIRHASLGMLTVPHGQRSTRVVEAILKDGDRILGEVLAETDHFTVIRSATLGTVAVQHEQVAMLNRKIEQMQLRSLTAPALGDVKPDAPSPS